MTRFVIRMSGFIVLSYLFLVLAVNKIRFCSKWEDLLIASWVIAGIISYTAIWEYEVAAYCKSEYYRNPEPAEFNFGLYITTIFYILVGIFIMWSECYT